jgi:hypothetical protein
MRKAYLSIYNILVDQSTLLAFVDNLRLLGFFSLVGVPLALLFKSVALKRTIRSSVAE